MSALHRRIAARLRMHAAIVETEANEQLADVAKARALADELESDTPPSLSDATQRGTTLFRRRCL